MHAIDDHYSSALHWACHSNNVEAVRILCAAGSDLKKRMFPGMDPLSIAVGSGAGDVVEELLRHKPKLNLQFQLHQALMWYNVSETILTTLLHAEADVNERLRMPTPTFRTILFALSVQHRLSPSLLTSLAYHQHLATPLMLSILTLGPCPGRNAGLY